MSWVTALISIGCTFACYLFVLYRKPGKFHLNYHILLWLNHNRNPVSLRYLLTSAWVCNSSFSNWRLTCLGNEYSGSTVFRSSISPPIISNSVWTCQKLSSTNPLSHWLPILSAGSNWFCLLDHQELLTPHLWKCSGRPRPVPTPQSRRSKWLWLVEGEENKSLLRDGGWL